MATLGCASGVSHPSEVPETQQSEIGELESRVQDMSKKVALLEEERAQLLRELERRAETGSVCSAAGEATPALATATVGAALGAAEEVGRIDAATGSLGLAVAPPPVEAPPVATLTGSADLAVPEVAAGVGADTVMAAEPGGGERGAKAAPEPPLLLSGSADADLYDQGTSALNRGEYHQAEALLSRFLRENPRHPFADDALVFRGEARRLSSRLELARSDFEAALQRYPDELLAPDAWLGLGRVRLSLGDRKGAGEAFAVLCQRHPHSSAALEVPEEFRP